MVSKFFPPPPTASWPCSLKAFNDDAKVMAMDDLLMRRQEAWDLWMQYRCPRGVTECLLPRRPA